ncbi:MAG TPA: SHOCT domain-containing protein [Gammaproteobacteria bacterium]
MWDYMQSYHGGWGMGWFGFPLMLLFWGVLIFGVVMLVRFWGEGRSSGSRRPDAVDILKERYARGEISLEEYEERKRNLEK